MPQRYIEDAQATWSAKKCAFTIEYSLQVIEEIRAAVLDASFSVPRGGAEIGGILFGRNDGRRVTITDYKALHCEHATGPSFVLSPKDHAKLAEMLAMARSNPDVQPVGWYHSHTRSEIHLSEADLEIHRHYFPESHQVALVLKPHMLEPVTAGFFFQESDGFIRSSGSYHEFTLSPLAAPPMPGQFVAVVPPSTPVRTEESAGFETTIVANLQTKAVAPESSNASGPRKSATLLKSLRWTCLLLVVFVAGASVNNPSFLGRLVDLWRSLSSAVPASPVPSGVSPNSSMSLRAKRQNSDLELTWSRESALIASATSGVISIKDGQVQRRIDLDATQVRGGSVLYSPTSDQIVMQLTVQTPIETGTESVMVILPKGGQPQTQPLPAPGSSFAALPLERGSQVKAPKPFTPPPPLAAIAAPAPPMLTDAPPLKPANEAAAVAPKILSETSLVVAPAIPQTTASPSASAVAPSRQVSPPQTPLQFQQPPQSHELPSNIVRYEPASPIRQVGAIFPPELRGFADIRKVVEVRVEIGKNGRVTKAEGIPQKNLSQYLVNAAVSAALQWRFQPARRDNEVVSSESILKFVFGR